METINSKSFLKNIAYYGSNDYAGGFFVKDVCENLDYLENISNCLGRKVESIDDLYHFMWCLSFKKMVSEINNIKVDDSYKNRILKLNDNILLCDSSFVNYINNNYKYTFDKQNHDRYKWVDFFYYALELLYGRYCNGIKEETFKFLENEFALYILSHFESCSNYYSKHKNGLEILFKDLKNTKPFDDQIYLKFLIKAPKRDDKFLKEQATFICERAINLIKSTPITEDNQDIIQIQSLMIDYGKLAMLFKLKCANEYSLLKKSIKVALDSFIKKYGIHHQSGPYDLSEAINYLKSNDDNYVFLQITHHKNEKGIIENSLNYIFNTSNKNNPLSELFNDISRNRSDKYPYYKQDNMQLNLWIRVRIINLIYDDEELLGRFVNYLYNIALQLQEKYFNNLIDIEKEISGEVDCISAMLDLERQNQFETPYGKALVYNTSLAICTTIEKILRNVALEEVKNEMYFNSDKVTIGDFFRYPFKLKDISDALKYHLEFYLIKEVNYSGLDMDKPGLNIRNNLMHGQDDVYENTDYVTCLTLFYFLVSLLDDLLISMEPIENESV